MKSEEVREGVVLGPCASGLARPGWRVRNDVGRRREEGGGREKEVYKGRKFPHILGIFCCFFCSIFGDLFFSCYFFFVNSVGVSFDGARAVLVVRLARENDSRLRKSVTGCGK